MPASTYNPKLNFKQGQNTEALEIPGRPNGPVVLIDHSKPTHGIHGTPEPELVDKVGSHAERYFARSYSRVELDPRISF